MKKNQIMLAYVILFIIFSGVLCTGDGDQPNPSGNPFLEPQGSKKDDSGYINLAGLEADVTLEGDISAPAYSIFEAPTNLAQFAVTYFRKRLELYIELLAEDMTAPDRVEWLVAGKWITASEAKKVQASNLTHFRLQTVNTVFLNETAEGIQEGTVFKAKVPQKPYSVMTEAKDTCADPNSHITLSQSVYWYLWNPDKSGCKVETKDLTLTVTKVHPKNPLSYPEYDKLLEDKQLTVVVLFGKLDDKGPIEEDFNWGNAEQFCEFLTEAGFKEESKPELGRRFIKTIGDLTEIVDVYFPNLYNDLTDYSNFKNWQKAINEHEVVIYLGHSILGTGSAYDEVEYPNFYQIFLIGGCLGYEYYVRPVLTGKGSWDQVDAVSSIIENTYYELNEFTGAFLARLFYGFENGGKASWQDILSAINRKLGHAHFGVSGARGNCFSPEGNKCNPPENSSTRQYQNTTVSEIPDNSEQGITSQITVPEAMTIKTLTVELDISHTYVSDLKIVLTHNGEEYILWNHAGEASDNIVQTFSVEQFSGITAKGEWTLQVIDTAAVDTGSLNQWTLTITPKL